MIYAAFRQQYGIDLADEKLHWWKFLALFDALDDSTLFVRVMQWRNTDLSKADKSKRDFIASMQRRYRLRDERQEAIDKELDAAIESGDGAKIEEVKARYGI